MSIPSNSGEGTWPTVINRGSQLLEVEETRQVGDSVRSLIQTLRRQPLFGGSVVAFLLLCALSTAVGTVVGLANFRDVGYPDSSDLLRIGEFIHTGHIYPDGDRPPYLVSLYGPLTYVLLSVPYRLAQFVGVTPQLPVRLAIVCAVCLCMSLIYLISRRLYNSRSIALLCALFALSTLPMAQWTTQIRSDFLGLAVSLASVYWFLARNGCPQTIGAAVCAGLAPLFKQTFLAAPIGVVAWLIYRRRYKEATLWAVTVALTVACGYAMEGWREPLMFKTVAALRHPVLEYSRGFAILLDAVCQPVVPFAAMGALLAIRRRATDSLLLLCYCSAAWLMAILIDPQAGGTINYFWEPLVVSAVLAGPGLCELQSKVSRTPTMVKAIVFVLLLWAFVPMLREQLAYLTLCRTNISQYHARKARWEAFVSTVSGRRLLSTSSDVALLSSTVEMPDPFLNSTLELRGGWNSAPMAAQIDAGVYDLIVTKDGEAENHKDDYRGIRKWSAGMWGALQKTYGPACVFKGDNYVQKFGAEGVEEVWLPRGAAHDILPRLLSIGCLPVTKPIDSGSAVGHQAE
jgi:Dolichyl-phosphate-mannose-protein mannosyltransferase